MTTGMPNAKLKPLTETTISAMVSMRARPFPAQEANPGVIDRLRREDLIEFFPAPSPYKTRKGDVNFVKLSPAGEDRLKELGR